MEFDRVSCEFGDFKVLENKIWGKDWGRNLIWSYCGWVVALRELPQPGEIRRISPYLNANETARWIMD